MGSSSTYTVGLLNALHAYQGRHAGAERLAREACQIEIDVCRKPIGKQDQYIAAYGGIQFIRFNPDGTTFVDPIICSPETKAELQRRLLLFYTGVTRSADPILGEQQSEHCRQSGGAQRPAADGADGAGDARHLMRQRPGQLRGNAARELDAEKEPGRGNQQSAHRRVL